MMIQAGDMVRLLDDSCNCDFCDRARAEFHQVESVYKNTIILFMPHLGGPVRMEGYWEYEILSPVQENE